MTQEDKMQDDIDSDFDFDLASDTSDLPTSVILTNVDPSVFVDDIKRSEFERIFSPLDAEISFQYFNSFRRVRINFSNPETAAVARIQCHETKILDSVVNCYFAQPSINQEEVPTNNTHLRAPSPVRQFLISPPASPPVGWEPVDEARPCMNYDLLSALAQLTPGEAHELHPPSEDKPAIVVHICEEMKDSKPRVKISQTRRPNS